MYRELEKGDVLVYVLALQQATPENKGAGGKKKEKKEQKHYSTGKLTH